MIILFTFRFRQFLIDLCIFIHHERQLIIGLHVDDIPIASPHIIDIIWFKKAIV